MKRCIAGALCTLLILSLSACGKTPSDAVITMDTQYYNTMGAIVEIPIIQNDDSEAVQAINDDLQQLKQQNAHCWEAPFGVIGSEVFAFPTTTDRYISITLLCSNSNDGEVHSWVYDKTDRRALTWEDALTLAKISQDELYSTAEVWLTDYWRQALSSSGDVERTSSLEPAGFRVRSDGGIDLFLYGHADYIILPDGQGEFEEFQLLLCWSDGAFTRTGNFIPPNSPEYQQLAPTEQVDVFSSPLWCQWQKDGAPPDGFTTPPLPEGVPEFQEALRDLMVSLYGVEDPDALIYSYDGARTVLNQDCQSVYVYHPDTGESFGTFYQNKSSGELYTDSYGYFLRVVPTENGAVLEAVE